MKLALSTGEVSINVISPTPIDPTAPLAVRMRPRSLDEVIGQQHLLRPGSPLRVLATEAAPGVVSVILWGPPGTGKTTLAQAIAHSSGRRFVELSAVTAGVKDVRAAMEQAQADRDLYGISTVLFLDEVHRFTKAQQDALLPGVENGWVTLIAATTENPSFSVVSPLLSRSLLLVLEPLADDDLRTLVRRAVADPRGLDHAVALSDPALEALVQFAAGDARRSLTALEAAAAATTAVSGQLSHEASDEESCDKPVVEAEAVTVAVDRALLRYDRDGDEHHDVVSAFIKSMRGSDPDAALHYLARMIEAGEDPRFIARRLVVHAAEDVGLADPQALQVAVAAAEAVQFVGLPEARIPLAEAAIYIAIAPKSNATIAAIDAAISDVRRGKIGVVPKHLRHSHNRGARLLGHGRGYKSPHNDPRGVLRQQHLPDELAERIYYQPSDRGNERAVGERLDKIQRITKGTS